MGQGREGAGVVQRRGRAARPSVGQGREGAGVVQRRGRAARSTIAGQYRRISVHPPAACQVTRPK